MKSFRFGMPGKFASKARSIAAGGALVAMLAITLLAPPMAGKAEAAGRAASAARPVPFLTLPFEPNSGMEVLSGWYYNRGGFHGGIDFINGNYNNLGSWRTFPVIASADGEACGNCTSREGNAVWVKHNVNGQTIYTYYGHLASIAEGIPIGSQSRTVHVTRGQFLGWAGDTGARGMLHLHFGVYDASSRPIEPYAIGKLRGAYPAPTSGQPGIGWFLSTQQTMALRQLGY